MATFKLETFPPGTPGNTATNFFASKLQNAVTTAAMGTVIDCTSYTGTITLSNTITITRSVTLIFGNLTILFTGAGKNLFNVLAPNVKITGVSRSTNTDAVDGKTVFSMTNSSNGGYHIYCANNSSSGPSSNWKSYSGFTLENVDLLGVQSVYTSVGTVATYSLKGVGGILVAEGNPGQSNTNVQNVLISNVFINGTTAHGIMLYGAMVSKIEKCRVTKAGGHAYYIAGGSTSVSLDTCYALSSTLAGFCLHSTSYSSLNNCASDNCGLGYWLRSTSTTTLVGCGTEASIIKSVMPYNLGLTLPSSAGNVTINDIGSDNINYVKGTSYFISGGESNTLVNPYSKDPGNRAGETTYASKYTAHLVMYGGTNSNNVISPKFTGSSPVKYIIRLDDLSGNNPRNCNIQYAVGSFDPTNPVESPDTDYLPVADVLDQGGYNVYGVGGQLVTWGESTIDTADGSSYYRINRLAARDSFVMPFLDAAPDNPVEGSTYFNYSDDKIYVYNGTTWTGH